jgi:hypothetical protein
MLEHLAPIADLLPRSVGPYMSLMVLGFLIGMMGHLSRSRWLVAIGIMLIFLATLIFPLARIATEENPPPPDNPRVRQAP